MSLTRQLLKDLQLGDEAIEQVIAAHIETVNALKAERDASSAELEALRAAADQSAAEVQAAFDAYRTQAATRRPSPCSSRPLPPPPWKWRAMSSKTRARSSPS